tara:strand:- start:1963 stop:2784 length:822 start_codon:yes stop_codon:yes gene_type:complete
MSRQLQGQKQTVIINLAPKPKRKKRRKKKSKAINAVGDFRTALARSAYIQRGIGGLGFNQPPPFKRNIDANAVRLNARTFFEGNRRERPNLRTVAQDEADPNPADTSIGSVRGNIYTPRFIPENASFTTIFGSSRGGSSVGGLSEFDSEEAEEASSDSGFSIESDFSIITPKVKRRTGQEVQEAEGMGLEDSRRNVEDLYTQQGVRAMDAGSRTRIENARERQRVALNALVAKGQTLGGEEAEEKRSETTVAPSAPSLYDTDAITEEEDNDDY